MEHKKTAQICAENAEAIKHQMIWKSMGGDIAYLESLKTVKERNAYVAQICGVSVRYYEKTCYVLENSTPEFIKILEANELINGEKLSVDLAEKIIRNLPNWEDQRKIIQWWRDGLLKIKNLPKMNYCKKTPSRKKAECIYNHNTKDGRTIKVKLIIDGWETVEEAAVALVEFEENVLNLIENN